MMKKLMKFYRPMAVAVVASLMLSAVAVMPAMAQESPASSPSSAVSPSSEWVTIDADGTHWYTFNYDYDGDGDPTQAIVELEMAVEDSVSFEIWTSTEVNLWANGEDFDPVGRGSILNEGNDDEDPYTLIWAGSETASGAFYVIVENERSEPSQYLLDITGDDVYFTAPEFEAASESAVVEAEVADVQSETLEVAAEAADDGAEPDSALAPSGEWITLDPDESLWYTFDYDYDGDGDPSDAIVELEMGVEGSVRFAVWTSGELSQLALSEDVYPVGLGSILYAGTDFEDPYTLVWDGSETASDTYYVHVGNVSDSEASFLLTISGEDVSY